MKLLLCLALLISPFAQAQCLLDLLAPAVTNGVTLYGEVNDKTAAKLIGEIQAANALKTADPIFLYINSPGGDVLAGGTIIDAMTASRRPVYTVVVGMAASMAALIHSYGTHRFMTAHSVLMFHNASASLDDDLSHITERVGLIGRVIAVYEAHIAKLTGLTVVQVQAHENTQWWLLAPEAEKAHLIDAIVAPTNYPTK